MARQQQQNKPYVDRFNESVAGWHQPNDMDLVRAKPAYSPIGTPPKLRTLVTPPGTEPYRNSYNLRRLTSPLPTVDDLHTPLHLDSWGLQPVDYRVNQDLHTFIRQPSALTSYGLGNKNHRQKKSYIVVPRLSTLTTPPVSTDGLDSRFTGTLRMPDSQYRYLERMHAYSANYRREPSDTAYVRKNEAFAYCFIDDFIDKCIADQFVPDIMLEVLGELDQEQKKTHDPKHPRFEANEYLNELNKRVGVENGDSRTLFSDQWIRELDYQRPPVTIRQVDFDRTPAKRLDFRDLVDERTTTRYQNPQDPLLNSIVQDVVHSEVQHMTTDISHETVTNAMRNGRAMNDIYRDIESETVGELSRETAYDTQTTEKKFVSQVQLSSIDRHAQNKLLDTIFLDQLIGKYIRQSGSVVDVDDLSRFLDVTILDNLIYQYQDISESRSRTLDNYALRKFHLNSFMNMTMDLLLTELSASLIEDMKDLDEQERRVF